MAKNPIFYLFSLFCTVNCLNIASDTTLTGNQTINEAITVAKGATLVIEGGSSYIFNNDIDVEGTLQIIGLLVLRIYSLLQLLQSLIMVN